MPITKDKCVCQICICGRHNCECLNDNENRLNIDSRGKVKDFYNNFSNKKSIDEHHKIIKFPILIESSLNEEIDDNSNKILIRHKRIIDKEFETMNIDNLQQHQEQQQQKNDLENERSLSECLIINDDDDQNQQQRQNQRQTWKTSPEQVEELTRSLSRIRNDEYGNRTYQKSKTKLSTKTTTTTEEQKPIPIPSTSEKQIGKTIKKSTKSNKFMKKNQSKKQHQQSHYMLPLSVVSTTSIVDTTNDNDNNNETINEQTITNGFLPPITGFSDTDSSFSSSVVCSSVDDCDKIHCICETLKKTHLEEHRHQQQQPQTLIDNDGINYFNIDDTDNWIVVRPKRTKPRDNLKLEGSMDMETTFRSTYGGNNYNDDIKSKSSNSQYSQQHQLYFNTKRGRHSGSTPILRSATKRKTIRNRPKTSLKTGGHGYWSTNNRDAYKNFIIINGEAKTINNNNDKKIVKLPKVIQHTTMLKNEEKNCRKYNIIDNDNDNDNDDRENQKIKPLHMIDGKGMKKFQKKTYIQTSDGNDELMSEKLVHKIHLNNKKKLDNDNENNNINANNDDENKNEEKEQLEHHQQQQQQQKHRPYDAYYVDNIKDFGLLEMNNDNDQQQQQQNYNYNDLNNQNYRSHLRRLHETSDDFHILTGGIDNNNNKIDEKKLIKTKTKNLHENNNNDQTKKSLILNGHAIMYSTHRPFILPQRIQRHKNECSIPLFDGDMEFTTTTKSTYRNLRQGSGGQRRRNQSQSQQQQQQQPERKRTAGRRTLRSGRRRNLFRQSSDSIFARPDTADKKKDEQQQHCQQEPKQQPKEQKMTKTISEKSIYKSEFSDRSLYCPALDVINPAGPNNPYKMTNETGGHKYYNVEK